MGVLTGYSLFVLVLLGCVSVTAAGEYCNRGGYDLGEYCSYGCCGSSPYQYCCSVGTGTIVGSIFSSITGFFILIAICCCCARRRRTQIIRTTASPAANVTVVSTNSSSQHPVYAYDQQTAPQTHYMHQHPSPPQPMQPPPYSSTQGAAPAYGYPNPGYPMGQQPPHPGYPMGQQPPHPGYPMGQQPPQATGGDPYANPGYPMGQQPPQATGGDPYVNPAAFGAKH